MKQVTIYHNQSCSKSLKVLELLTEAGYEPEVINYLTDPPGLDQLKALGLPAKDLIRQTDPLYAELGLPDGLEDQAIYETLVKYPALIQRPIVVTGSQALICRPPERVWELVAPHV
ncbi:arsenate reductase [Streptococcus rupicaprae]|uniref:Arsenate reductase n=1 Tax=Streptococcus rupicaprae TaxID=759619 RepID=A0ABV2FF97_9STRE